MFGHWEQIFKGYKIKEWFNLIALWYFSQRNKKRNWWGSTWGLEIPILHQDEKSEAISRYSNKKKSSTPWRGFPFPRCPLLVSKGCRRQTLQRTTDWPGHTTPWHLTSDSVKPNIISFVLQPFWPVTVGKAQLQT